MKKTSFALILLLAGAAGASAAPNLFTYQGRLKEGGLAVTGNRTVELFLCDAETGPTCTTTAAQPVAVTNGLFRSTFTMPAGLDLGAGSWWLEIKIGADTLAPRERLTSNAYALFAATAAFAENISAAPGSAGVSVSSSLFVTGALSAGPAARPHAFFVSTTGVVAIGDFADVEIDTDAVLTVRPVLSGEATAAVGVNAYARTDPAAAVSAGADAVLAGGNFEVSVGGDDSVGMVLGMRGQYRREGAGAGSVAKAVGVLVAKPHSDAGAGAVTDSFGLYIEKQHMDDSGIQVNRPYALYSEDPNAPSVFSGFLGISSATPAAALVVSSAAGSADKMLIVSTGSSEIFSVKGNGEVYTAGKFIGDGSLLFNLPAAGGSVSSAGDTMTGQLTVMSSVTVIGSDGGQFSLAVSTDPARRVYNLYVSTGGRAGVNVPSLAGNAYFHVMTGGSGDFDNVTIQSPASNAGYGLKFLDSSGETLVGRHIGNSGDTFAISDGSYRMKIPSASLPIYLTGPSASPAVLYVATGTSSDKVFANFSSAGRLGVGSMAPVAKLDVLETDVEASSYTLRASSSASSYHLVLTTAGWLGLGNPNPHSMLHVAGADGNTGAILEHASDSADQWATGWLALMRSRGGFGPGQALVQQDDPLGALVFLGYDGFNTADGPYRYGAAIKALVDGAPTANGADMPGRLEFQTSPDGSAALATRLTIRNDGSVGIGTGTPYAVLDVVSTATAVNVYAQIWRNGGGIVVASMTSQGVLYATLPPGAGDNLGTHAATQDLNLAGFNLNNAAQVSVSSVTGPGSSYIYVNQNMALPASSLAIGRGTSNAGYPLAVYGDSGGIAPVLQLENKTSAPGSGVRLNFTGNGSGWGSIDVVDESGIGSTSMRFGTFSGELLRLHGARVGIGATAPDQKLTVAGNISQTGVLISSGAGKNYFAGSVGIGTSDPAYKLHLYDSGPLLGTLESQSASNVQFLLKNSVNEWSLLNDGGDSSKLKILLTGSAKLTVSGDDVGIGTQSPGYRLDVQGGNINASGGLCIAGNCKASWASVGDNLGDHNAANNLQMNWNSIYTVSSVTASGDITAARYQINGSTALAFTGTSSINLGSSAGMVNKGSGNVFVGAAAGMANTTGSNNVIIGDMAGFTAITGARNQFIGSGAGYSNLYGTGNSVMGYMAGYGQTGNSFSSSTLLGYQAGYSLQGNAYGNTLLGYQAGNSVTTGSNNIIIGYDQDTPTSGTSNHLNIGGVIYGDLSTGRVGIGAPSPTDLLTLKKTGDGDIMRMLVSNGGSFETGIRWEAPAGFSLAAIRAKDMGYAGVDANYAGDLIFLADPGVQDVSLVERMRIGYAGGVGMGAPAPASPQAALDVVSTGATSGYYAQIWRASGGTAVASMTATGMLQAAKVDVTGDVFRVAVSSTINNSTDPCNAGEVRWDSSYIYVCVAANSWRRATIASW